MPDTTPLTRRSVLTGLAATVLAGCASSVRGDRAAGRLVTLDGTTAALALLLGLPQVGTASFMAADPLLPAIGVIQGAPVADVSGAGGGIEVERLAALRPDQVVGFRTSGAEPGRRRARGPAHRRAHGRASTGSRCTCSAPGRPPAP
jgi:ABC-type Fe3+-hydroxamate transport system substrate-binding protein